jgi:hypothetical protein
VLVCYPTWTSSCGPVPSVIIFAAPNIDHIDFGIPENQFQLRPISFGFVRGIGGGELLVNHVTGDQTVL